MYGPSGLHESINCRLKAGLRHPQTTNTDFAGCYYSKWPVFSFVQMLKWGLQKRKPYLWLGRCRSSLPHSHTPLEVDIVGEIYNSVSGFRPLCRESWVATLDVLGWHYLLVIWWTLMSLNMNQIVLVPFDMTSIVLIPFSIVIMD